MIGLKYFPTQDYSFLLDENHYVYDHIETEDSLHIYIKSKEHSCACPGCVQVADRFHLLQNLLGYMKDIFKEEMPPKIYIQDGNISEKAPEKILKEKTPEGSFLESLHYDNTPPVDPSGNVIAYDNKKHDLNSAQYQHQEKTREKNSN